MLLSKSSSTYCDYEIKPKKEKELCPECGKYVTNLKFHYKTTHTPGTGFCPQCGQSGIKDLKGHIQSVHEKIPCAHCAMLIGKKQMHRW